MNRRASVTTVAAIVLGIAVSLLAPSIAAVGQVSPPQTVLKIADHGTLVARGAAVAVPIRVVVSCDPGAPPPTVQVQVVQAVGRNRVAHAFGSSSDIRCDGTPQTVRVFALSQDFQFQTGPAFASAFMFACSGPFPDPSCAVSTSRQIRLETRSGRQV